MKTGIRMADSKRRNRLKNIVGLLLAPVVLFALLRWFEFRSVFQPSSNLDFTGDEIGFSREDVWFETSDGIKLHAWYFPNEKRPGGRVFLICHGNGGNISHRMHLYDVLLREGVGVLAFDYRGYGRSRGSPDEIGTYRDAAAAYQWLLARGYQPTQIVAFGESLGGGVVSKLALQNDLAGLVLMSTYTSAEDLGSELFPWLPVRTVGKVKYPTLERLPKIHVPVLVMHGSDDTIIPVHHGRRIFEAANEPKLFQELKGDHNDTFAADRSAVSNGIRRYLTLLDGERKEVADTSRTEPNAANADEEKESQKEDR